MHTGLKWLIVAGVVAVPVLFVATSGCSCSDTTHKAYVAGAKTALRSLVAQQESSRAHGGGYRTSFDTAPMGISRGVTLEILEASDSGWQARARHAEMDGSCAVWVGRVASRPMVRDSAPAEGEPRCAMAPKP